MTLDICYAYYGWDIWMLPSAKCRHFHIHSSQNHEPKARICRDSCMH